MKPFEESDRYNYRLLSTDVVLDCGGYEGNWAAGIFEKYHCTVHVLEPVKRFYDQIARRFADTAKVYVHNVGIGAETRMAKFSIKGDMTGEFADNPETEEVQLKSVEDVFEELALKEVACMKLNLEGGEFAVVERLLDTGLINNVAALQVQWHDVAPNAAERYEALQRRLARTRRLTFDHGWIWQSWQRMD